MKLTQAESMSVIRSSNPEKRSVLFVISSGETGICVELDREELEAMWLMIARNIEAAEQGIPATGPVVGFESEVLH